MSANLNIRHGLAHNNSLQPTYSPSASIPSLTLGAAELKR